MVLGFRERGVELCELPGILLILSSLSPGGFIVGELGVISITIILQKETNAFIGTNRVIRDQTGSNTFLIDVNCYFLDLEEAIKLQWITTSLVRKTPGNSANSFVIFS